MYLIPKKMRRSIISISITLALLVQTIASDYVGIYFQTFIGSGVPTIPTGTIFSA
jgi:hypothetical protein